MKVLPKVKTAQTNAGSEGVCLPERDPHILVTRHHSFMIQRGRFVLQFQYIVIQVLCYCSGLYAHGRHMTLSRDHCASKVVMDNHWQRVTKNVALDVMTGGCPLENVLQWTSSSVSIMIVVFCSEPNGSNWHNLIILVYRIAL